MIRFTHVGRALGCCILFFTIPLLSFGQLTFDWAHISDATNTNLLEYEVHFTSLEGDAAPETVAAELEAEAFVNAAKLDTEAGVARLYVSQSQPPSRVQQLLTDAGVNVDLTWYARQENKQPADRVQPLLVASTKNIDTYVIDLPASLSDREQYNAQKALLGKEGVLEVSYPLASRCEVQVKDFFTVEMLSELMLAAVETQP